MTATLWVPTSKPASSLPDVGRPAALRTDLAEDKPVVSQGMCGHPECMTFSGFYATGMARGLAGILACSLNQPNRWLPGRSLPSDPMHQDRKPQSA
jgi:hypothetical protein